MTNLYQVLTAQTAADARRTEFHEALCAFASVCREPSMLLLAGFAAGATLAAILVAVAK